MTAAEVERWRATRGFRIGAATGALVLTLAGGAWAFAALANRPNTPSWWFGVAAAPAVALIVWGIRRLLAIRRTAEPSTGANAVEAARRGRTVGIAFGIVFAIEVVAIGITAPLLARANRPLLIPIAVVAIVGAHFLPLARIFHVPAYGIAGALLVAVAFASLLIADERRRIFDVAIVAALVLWVSAGWVLFRHARQSRLAAIAGST